jgi:heat shock protein HslJ
MRFIAPLSAAVLALCAVPALAHQEKLQGSEWTVIGDPAEGGRFISFAGSGRVFGFGGCNRFSGSYEQHDEHLKISPLAMTKMACPPDKMQKEREFLDVLSKVRGVRVDHTLLLFLDENGSDLKALSRRNVEPAPSTEE